MTFDEVTDPMLRGALRKLYRGWQHRFPELGREPKAGRICLGTSVEAPAPSRPRTTWRPHDRRDAR